MTRAFTGLAALVPHKLRTMLVKRFSRFVVAAAAALGANQITLTICLGVLRVGALQAALTAWIVSAGVSYLVSRWAWERKGRPQVFKETLPFWLVSIGAGAVLASVTKLANYQAIAMHLSVSRRVLFDDAANFLANCFTFITRFLIFHYILFRERRPEAAPAGVAGPGGEPPLVTTGVKADE